MCGLSDSLEAAAGEGIADRGEGFFRVEEGIVDEGGSGGDHERGAGARLVRLVALADAVGFSLGGAAGGADFFRGIDVEFPWGFREDDTADVAAFHDEGSVFRHAAEDACEHAADFRVGRHRGDVFIDEGIAQERLGILSIDAEFERTAGGVSGNGEAEDVGGDRCFVAGIDAGVEDGPCGSAVERAAVHVGAVELFGEAAGDAAFSGGGRAIDGDHGHEY